MQPTMYDVYECFKPTTAPLKHLRGTFGAPGLLTYLATTGQEPRRNPGNGEGHHRNAGGTIMGHQHNRGGCGARTGRFRHRGQKNMPKISSLYEFTFWETVPSLHCLCASCWGAMTSSTGAQGQEPQTSWCTLHVDGPGRRGYRLGSCERSRPQVAMSNTCTV